MSEARLQQECFMWFNNSFPDLRGLLCYNLNNTEGGRRGNINKFLGIIPGRSDMVLYFEGKAIMIELKTEIGTQSANQKKWQSLVEKNGFEYFIVRSLSEFQNLIKTIVL